MSLFALIFSIGILVDDAIVVIEHRAALGLKTPGDRVQKAITAVAEVATLPSSPR
ncbi:MAG: efflux RND transporter permease subunit [Paracoccaceae bacterium]